MKVPALWRKKKGGKAGGNWFAKINGEDVNLSTKNAELARGRLVEALRGKRDWPSDAELAAQSLEAEIEGAPAAEPDNQAGEARKSAQQPPAAVPPGPVVPDAVHAPRALPPIGAADDARAEAEATNAAAAELGGAGAAGESSGPEPPFSADALKGMLGVAAGALVEAQLTLQAWAIEKRTGKRPAPIPDSPDFPLRKIAADAWVVQFERWFPNMGDVPPWVLAAGLPLLALPVQIATAQPVPEAQKQEDPPPAQAAA